MVVEHGPWVETDTTFFAEGAWDGRFDTGDIDQAAVVLGSGGRVLETEAVFCTTSHTMERLQSVRVGDSLFISNSFVYLLAATGDSLDLNYRYYERDFMTFLHGRRRATRIVPTRLGRDVAIYYGERVRADESLSLRTEPYPEGTHFHNYQDYIDAVDTLVTRLHDNATAPERKVRYEPISTLSSGYDSPACTVFAKKIGCQKAITIVDAREDYNPYNLAPKDPSDHGTEIARHLQVEISAFRRNTYLSREDYPEAEFLATGNGGDDVVLSVAEKDLPGTMLFTGFLGDTLWGLSPMRAEDSRDYIYRFPAGSTLSEFRLRTGFVHVPIPLLTYARQADLVRIARSEEMAPWRIGGQYDRPIPRRLVESCGVPRAIYAQEKKAVSQPFWLPLDRGAMQAMMSPASYDSLLGYAGSATIKSGYTLSTKLKTLFAPLIAPSATRHFNWYNRSLQKTLGFRLLPDFRADQFQPSVLYSAPAGLKFHWAVDRISNRYRHTECQ